MSLVVDLGFRERGALVISSPYQTNKLVQCLSIENNVAVSTRIDLGLQRLCCEAISKVPSPLAPPSLYILGWVPESRPGWLRYKGEIMLCQLLVGPLLALYAWFLGFGCFQALYFIMGFFLDPYQG